MSKYPQSRGIQVLTVSRIVSETNGVEPFRVVILDSSVTPSNVSPMLKVKYPAIAISNGERVEGITLGPVNTLSGSLAVCAANKEVNVVTIGECMVECDTGVDSTNILVGDLVAHSAVSGQNGCIAKAGLTNNYPTAGQHIVGRALGKATVEGQYILVHIAIQEV